MAEQNRPAPRSWVDLAPQFVEEEGGGTVFGDLDRQQVRDSLMDAESILFRFGGMVTLTAVRIQVGENEYATVGVMYDHAFAPPVRPADPGPPETETGAPPTAAVALPPDPPPVDGGVVDEAPDIGLGDPREEPAPTPVQAPGAEEAARAAALAEPIGT